MRTAITQARLAPGTNRRFSYGARTTVPDAVWRLWTDVERWPEWDTELLSATLDGPMGIGARGRLRPKRGPGARFEVTVWEPGRRYAFTTRMPLATLTVERRFEGDDRAQLVHEVRFEGLLGGLFAAMLGPRYRAALPRVVQKVSELAADGVGA